MARPGYLDFYCPFCGRKSSLKESLEPLDKKKLCRGCNQIFVLTTDNLLPPQHQLAPTPVIEIKTSGQPAGLCFIEETGESPISDNMPTQPMSPVEIVIAALPAGKSDLAFLESDPVPVNGHQKTEVIPQFSAQMASVAPDFTAPPQQSIEDQSDRMLPVLFCVLVAAICASVYYVREIRPQKKATRDVRASKPVTEPDKTSGQAATVSTDSEEEAFKDIGRLAEKTPSERYQKWQAFRQFMSQYPQGRFQTKARENSEILEQNLQQTATQWFQEIELAVSKGECIVAWNKYQAFPSALLQLTDKRCEQYKTRLLHLEQQIAGTVVSLLTQEAEKLNAAIANNLDVSQRISQKWQQESPTVWQEWLDKWPAAKQAFSKNEEIANALQKHLVVQQQKKAEQEKARQQKLAQIEALFSEFMASYPKKMKNKDYKGANLQLEELAQTADKLFNEIGERPRYEWILAWQKEQRCIQKALLQVEKKTDHHKGLSRTFRVNGREVKGTIHHSQQGKIYLQMALAVIAYPLHLFGAEDLYYLSGYSQEPDMIYAVAVWFFYENNSEKANQYFALVKDSRLQLLMQKFYPTIAWVHAIKNK
jgi:hypothetical protein